MNKELKKIAMIPARMGSQRLKHKNLREINGTSLVVHAIRRAIQSNAFDEIWVNSEKDEIGTIAKEEGVNFHKRPAYLADNNATSEDYIYEFLKTHSCYYLFQVHTIAPLLTAIEVREFVNFMTLHEQDTLMSVVLEQIECTMDGRPVNFSFNEKINSQELTPIQRITWSITGWRRVVFINAYENKECATYVGKVGFYPISRLAGHIIKTQKDLRIAQFLFDLVYFNA